MSTIFHIASQADWVAAQGDGEYRVSTKGRTLDEDGFIHCSEAHQVGRIANALYRGSTERLVVLGIATEMIDVEVVFENLEGGAELFPHVYGPIPLRAVVSVDPLERDTTGGFQPFG